jgi:hypothetical protein
VKSSVTTGQRERPLPKITPKIIKGGQETPNPLAHIEAPSTDMLNGNRLREELFHLERSVDRSNQTYVDLEKALEENTETIDKLVETVESLTTTLEAFETLLRKLVKIQEERTI